MRTLLVVLAILIFLVPFGIPALAILWILGRFNRDLADRITLVLLKGIFHILLFLAGVRLTVAGRENIPEDRAVLYVSNHRGMFDVVTGYTQVKGLCGFVAKKELEKIPLLRIWMRRLYCHFLDRQDPRAGMRTIQACIQQLKDGRSVWICPEGTRSKSEEMLEFKAGSFRIAEKSGAPVVPVAITHTDDVLEKHFPWIHGAQVMIEFAPPIETASLDRDQRKALPVQAHDLVDAMYKKNR